MTEHTHGCEQCPMLSDKNIQKQDLLYKSRKMSELIAKRNDPEAYDKLITAELGRHRQSDMFREEFGDEELPDYVEEELKAQIRKSFEAQCERYGLEISMTESRIHEIDADIEAWQVSCAGIVRLVGESKTRNTLIEVIVCDSPKTAGISENEPVRFTTGNTTRLP